MNSEIQWLSSRLREVSVTNIDDEIFFLTGYIYSTNFHLRINWYPDANTTDTYLVRVKEEKKDNEMTDLYRQAARLFQEIADITQKPVNYQLKTLFRKIVEWAKDTNKGLSVFGSWDEEYEIDTGYHIFKKTFRPRSRQ